MDGVRKTFWNARRFLMALAVVALILTGLGTAADRLELVGNPYANVDWDTHQQYKANLHSHTTRSDGALDPARVIREYRERGYSILALTDHNLCTWPWSKYDSDAPHNGMVAIAGNELSRHHHAQALFRFFETRGDDLDAVLSDVGVAGGLAILNHPAMHWPGGWERQVPSLQVKFAPTLRQITRADFTIEAWFRTKSNDRNILMGNYQGGMTGHLNLELHTGNCVRVFVSPTGERKTTDLRVSADTLDIETRDGKWHHLAGIRRDEKVLVYLDGHPVGDITDTAGAFDLSGDLYFIGRDVRTGSTTHKGDLDDVRLWNRALSVEEIVSIVHGKKPGEQGGPSRAGLLAQYEFDGSPDRPLRVGALIEEAVDDSAGHSAGPFPAMPTPGGAPTVIGEDATSDKRQALGALRASLRFTQVHVRSEGHVPDGVVEAYAQLMKRHPCLMGIEVLNGTRPLDEYPLDRELWDKLLTRLMPGRPVWGFSNDDSHGLHHIGHDWIWIPASELSEESVRDAVRRGTFFAVSTRIHRGEEGSAESTPRIARIEHDATTGTITITATLAGKPFPQDSLHWIADGKVIHTGSRLDYHATPGIRSYVRAELWGEGGILLTNPFAFSRTSTSIP